jgi:hypothetical protein
MELDTCRNHCETASWSQIRVALNLVCVQLLFESHKLTIGIQDWISDEINCAALFYINSISIIYAGVNSVLVLLAFILYVRVDGPSVCDLVNS